MRGRGATTLRHGLLALCLALALASCEGIDCTLNNVSLCNIYFYSSETGKSISLADTLTVTAVGTDSVLYNRGVNASYVSLPLSYHAETDTLVLSVEGEDYFLQSTLYVSKTNTEHYESPDCPTTMFHTITGAECRSSVVDSGVVKRAEVDYLQDENIRVYFHTAVD